MKSTRFFTVVFAFVFGLSHAVKLKRDGKIIIDLKEVIADLVGTISKGIVCFENESILAKYEFSFNEELCLSKLNLGQGSHSGSIEDSEYIEEVIKSVFSDASNKTIEDMQLHFSNDPDKADSFYSKAKQVFINQNSETNLRTLLTDSELGIFHERLIWRTNIMPRALIKSILICPDKSKQLFDRSRNDSIANICSTINSSIEKSEQERIAEIRKINGKLLTEEIARELLQEKKVKGNSFIVNDVKRILTAKGLMDSNLKIQQQVKDKPVDLVGEAAVEPNKAQTAVQQGLPDQNIPIQGSSLSETQAEPSAPISGHFATYKFRYIVLCLILCTVAIVTYFSIKKSEKGDVTGL